MSEEDLPVADNNIECLLDDDDDNDDTESREKNENRGDNNELPKHLLQVNPQLLQPVTANSLANVNFAQILTLLQTSFLTANSVAQTVNMPDHGTHAPADSTGVSGNNQLCHENDDNDELLRDITQEIEFEEEKGPPIHQKLYKIMQDLIWGIFKKEKLEIVIEKNLPPKNLENLEPPKVNLEVWNELPHKTKSIDIQQQHIVVHFKSTNCYNQKNIDKIFQAKKNKETDWPEIAKSCTKLCADTAMILGKANYELLTINA